MTDVCPVGQRAVDLASSDPLQAGALSFESLLDSIRGAADGVLPRVGLEDSPHHRGLGFVDEQASLVLLVSSIAKSEPSSTLACRSVETRM